MAPTCADPRQVVIALDPEQRRALWQLVKEACTHMKQSLQPTSDNQFGSVAPKDEVQDDRNKTSNTGNDDDTKRPPRTQPQKPDEDDDVEDVEQIKEGLAISRAAVRHLEEWASEFLPRLKEILQVKDDNKIIGERKKRQEELRKRAMDTADEGEDLMSFSGEVKINKSDDLHRLQELYKPFQNSLVKLPGADRREAVGCILLLLLSTGKYSAHSRALALYLASSLDLPTTFINNEEGEIAKSLMESGTADDAKKESMSAEAEAAKRREENKVSRFWKVGVASVLGATVIGVTGGLAAPLVAGAIGGIMGGVGLGGVASFLGIFWMNGALVGTLFGAFGAKMTGEMMDQYAKEVEDFRFIPLHSSSDLQPHPSGGDKQSIPRNERKSPSDDPKAPTDDRRLRVTICINGWLNSERDITTPWLVLPHSTEVFALRYELAALLALGSAMRDLVSSLAWKTLKSEIIKRTVLASLWAALWPLKLVTAASSIDNPFNRASNRSRKAGELLADALINRVQGERPVVLVGYSLGAAAIHACLQSLAQRRAFGLIDTVVLIGCPAPSTSSHWRTLRSVVSGRIFNVYSENDLLLGFVYRMHSLALGVAGLQPIKDVDGVVNIDLSDRVSGHLRYPDLTGEILSQCGFVGVRAKGDIEKDDVIRMKDEQADEQLIDFDGKGEEVRPKNERTESGESKFSDDLRELSISSPPPYEKETPPSLPRRPTRSISEDEGPPPALPTRPSSSKQEPLRRKPVAYREEVRRRPLTPETNASDDEEYRTISMVDNDSDDEHEEHEQKGSKGTLGH
ncbi:hypothetical protein NLU13_8202 [Sarocladium strictum]|uniref:Uncharacterized protein n=1 Tax=Sarocladium strictum TaxID=5046 RepID=A0AA39GB77_SARSR|nr:hypothetical protein NLU13_8202 [Sarocladium strictum]